MVLLTMPLPPPPKVKILIPYNVYYQPRTRYRGKGSIWGVAFPGRGRGRQALCGGGLKNKVSSIDMVGYRFRAIAMRGVYIYTVQSKRRVT
jgi:hypothetical protein